ncbi:MAG: LamG-like jellyroll fold domain-containing protein [Phycisphaerae bacterium]
MMSPKTNLTTCLMLAILLWATLCTAAVGKTVYVDDNADGANDGTSWVDAYTFLQEALADANSAEKPVEIRVVQGIYRPNQGLVAIPEFDWRTTTFQLINGVTLKGGYAGSAGPDPNIWDVDVYETILSGDLNGNDVEVADPCDLLDEPTRTDNSFRVVTGSGTNATAVLDGFTITGGNANSLPPYNGGGGMDNRVGSPNVINCTFNQNWGDGGGAIFSSASSSTISNCTFSNNSASRGGGIWNLSGSLTLINCAFTGNSAPLGGGIHNSLDRGSTLVNCTFSRNLAESGGGMRNEQSNVELINCMFSDNAADYGGGGMYNDDSSPALSNCILEENSAVSGGGMYNDNSSPTLLQCTFTENLAWIGSGMYNKGSPVVMNCTFSGSAAEYGGEIYCDGGSPVLTNCILWGDRPEEIFMFGGTPVITYSDVKGGWPGEGNIDADPLFADPNNGDYHLKSQAGRWDPNSESWIQDDVTSPCIDVGDPNSDWSSEIWPHGKRINMGAFGGTAEASMSLSDAGSRANCNNDDSVDVRDLMILCEDWLSEGQPTAADINRDSAVNFHDFALLAANWLQDISGDGLVAHWKLDETGGDIAYDSAGNNDATVHSGAWAQGRINGALQFNGFNTYVDCGDSEALGPEQMTFTVWLRPEHMGGMRYILSRANKSADETDYVLTRHLTGEVEFAVGQLGSDPMSVLSTAQTPLNEWSHVAVCLDGSEASVYINGQWDNSASYAQRVTREGHCLVISSYQGSTRFYNGKIDDVRIYDKALSAEEIGAMAH